MHCQMVGDLQVKIRGLERDISAERTTCGNADFGDNSEMFYIHAITEEGSDMRKLKIVEIKKYVGYS